MQRAHTFACLDNYTIIFKTLCLRFFSEMGDRIMKNSTNLVLQKRHPNVRDDIVPFLCWHVRQLRHVLLSHHCGQWDCNVSTSFTKHFLYVTEHGPHNETKHSVGGLSIGNVTYEVRDFSVFLTIQEN